MDIQDKIKFIIKQETRDNGGNTTSVDNNILENKEMKKLKQIKI